MRYLFILIMVLLITSCAKELETTTTQLTTTTRPSSTTEPITTSTIQSTTTSTTTTTFFVPENGELCQALYTPNLQSICNSDKELKYSIIASNSVATNTEVCSLVAQSANEDVLFISIVNYNEAPNKGLQPMKYPIFSMNRNLGINETGEISARYIQNNMNEIQFINNNYLIKVKTWVETINRPVACSSEETLEIAKIINNNFLNS